MKIRTTVGLVLIVVGVVTMPFGNWVAHIYYYAGLALVLVGVALASSALYKKDHDGVVPSNDSGIPVKGEASGFRGAGAFRNSDDAEVSSGSEDD
jgi:hypothetical protein